MTKSAFLVIFQTTIDGKLAQTDVPTVKNPLHSRQVRRDCEGVARAAFAKLAADIGQVFDGRIKCVECIEVREDAETGTTEAIDRKGIGH